MVTVDLNVAKEVGHAIRRQKRDGQFLPLDRIMAAQIPGTDFAAIEAARQAIRDRDAELQSSIDAATSENEIKTLLGL